MVKCNYFLKPLKYRKYGASIAENKLFCLLLFSEKKRKPHISLWIVSLKNGTAKILKINIKPMNNGKGHIHCKDKLKKKNQIVILHINQILGPVDFHFVLITKFHK